MKVSVQVFRACASALVVQVAKDMYSDAKQQPMWKVKKKIYLLLCLSGVNLK